MMLLAHKLQLYPTAAQAEYLRRCMGARRFAVARRLAILLGRISLGSSADSPVAPGIECDRCGCAAVLAAPRPHDGMP